ncbi:MAG: hypothetical protein ACQETE_00550 [Bacteroidota bacterium]
MNELKFSCRVFWAILGIAFWVGGCQSSSDLQRPEKPKFVPSNTWRPIYFGGREVGRAKYEADYFTFEDGSQVYQIIVTEEITFRDGKYQFKFVLEDALTSITILRFSNDGKRFLHSDSYKINLDVNAVIHTYYKEDGESVRHRREIYDKRKVAHTEQLFANTEDFIVSMYGSYVFRGDHYHRYARWRSWGYELLKYDRI